MRRKQGCPFECKGCMDYDLRRNRCMQVPQEAMKQEQPSGAFNLDDLLALHDQTCSNARAVMKAKNHDYTCGSVGVFDNFKASTMVGVNPVQGVLVRCLDKFKRVQTYLTINKLAVEGEGVLDAIDDVINYMILCKGLIIEEQRMKAIEPELPNIEKVPVSRDRITASECTEDALLYAIKAHKENYGRK